MTIQLSFNFSQNFHLVLFVALHDAFFSHKVGKICLTFILANSESEEMSKLVLQSKMGRTVSVSQTLVYAQYEIAQV